MDAFLVPARQDGHETAESDIRRVALGLMAEISLTYSERFDGFVLRRFDRTQVRVLNGAVEPVGS